MKRLALAAAAVGVGIVAARRQWEKVQLRFLEAIIHLDELVSESDLDEAAERHGAVTTAWANVGWTDPIEWRDAIAQRDEALEKLRQQLGDHYGLPVVTHREAIRDGYRPTLVIRDETNSWVEQQVAVEEALAKRVHEIVDEHKADWERERMGEAPVIEPLAAWVGPDNDLQPYIDEVKKVARELADECGIAHDLIVAPDGSTSVEAFERYAYPQRFIAGVTQEEATEADGPISPSFMRFVPEQLQHMIEVIDFDRLRQAMLANDPGQAPDVQEKEASDGTAEEA